MPKIFNFQTSCYYKDNTSNNDCLLICEDRFHDETWDKLVKDWAVKLRDEALENGTLFTRKWEEEKIPENFEDAIKARRGNEQEAAAKKKQEAVPDRCLTDYSLLAEGLLPVQERGEQTPQGPGAEVVRKSRKSRRGGKQSKLRRLLEFQTSLCGRCGLAPTRLMMEMRVAPCSTGEMIRLATMMRKKRKTKV